MRKSAKIISAVAVAGLAFAASAAFTGAGLTNNAGASQFVGGEISQTVSGATLSNVSYVFTDATNTAVSGVNLSFADAQSDGQQVTIALTDGSEATFTCTDVTAQASSCTLVDPLVPATNVTAATITVS